MIAACSDPPDPPATPSEGRGGGGGSSTVHASGICANGASCADEAIQISIEEGGVEGSGGVLGDGDSVLLSQVMSMLGPSAFPVLLFLLSVPSALGVPGVSLFLGFAQASLALQMVAGKCARTYTYIRTHLHTYAQIRTHTHAHLHMYMHAHRFTHTCARAPAHTHTCA